MTASRVFADDRNPIQFAAFNIIFLQADGHSLEASF
jgi:hypothetical protein